MEGQMHYLLPQAEHDIVFPGSFSIHLASVIYWLIRFARNAGMDHILLCLVSLQSSDGPCSRSEVSVLLMICPLTSLGCGPDWNRDYGP
ncbi:hypothetical protein ACRALDRAFT_1063091 [Sodiomyces alcalophilus JCM 7366]|uniref:uncharacterized protein n=1 Tax=Sodiomyces alcalophilus JCM 7366 TaxID=591952 RepID=UPI0039B6351E